MASICKTLWEKKKSIVLALILAAFFIGLCSTALVGKLEGIIGVTAIFFYSLYLGWFVNVNSKPPEQSKGPTVEVPVHASEDFQL